MTIEGARVVPTRSGFDHFSRCGFGQSVLRQIQVGRDVLTAPIHTYGWDETLSSRDFIPGGASVLASRLVDILRFPLSQLIDPNHQAAPLQIHEYASLTPLNKVVNVSSHLVIMHWLKMCSFGVKVRAEKTQLLDSIAAAFPIDAVRATLSLRQGDEIDSYSTPTSDVVPNNWRGISDQELEEHQWGFTHLDADSWRFYLPAFLSYSVRHLSRGDSLVVDTCLSNLRPPDRVPPRLSTLNPEQRRVVVSVLEFLAFDPESQFSEDACQVMEEYWIEHPLYPDT